MCLAEENNGEGVDKRWGHNAKEEMGNDGFVVFICINSGGDSRKIEF